MGDLKEADQHRPKKRQQCLTSDLLASSSSTEESTQTQLQCRTMRRLLYELRELEQTAWVVDDAATTLKLLISQTRDLQNIPAAWQVLRKLTIRALYSPACGPWNPHVGIVQDATHASMTACYALEKKVAQFVQARDEIQGHLQPIPSRPVPPLLVGNGC